MNVNAFQIAPVKNAEMMVVEVPVVHVDLEIPAFPIVVNVDQTVQEKNVDLTDAAVLVVLVVHVDLEIPEIGRASCRERV